MYKIGEFSKIVDIPVRTLRYYDEYGILQPKEVDEFTGYRYYSESNIAECEFIKLLKSLDFTLEEILKYKDCLNNEIIVKKKDEIKERIFLLKQKYERLVIIEQEINRGNNDYKKVNNETTDEVVLRRKYEKRIIGKGA